MGWEVRVLLGTLVAERWAASDGAYGHGRRAVRGLMALHWHHGGWDERHGWDMGTVAAQQPTAAWVESPVGLGALGHLLLQ